MEQKLVVVVVTFTGYVPEHTCINKIKLEAEKEIRAKIYGFTIDGNTEDEDIPYLSFDIDSVETGTHMNDKNLRVLKLHHPKGHPYWAKNEFKVELPNGRFIDTTPLFNHNGNYGGYEIFEKEGNIYFVQCGSSSGFGKQRHKEIKKIVDKSEYDILEYVGEELTMSKELINEVSEFGYP